MKRLTSSLETPCMRKLPVTSLPDAPDLLSKQIAAVDMRREQVDLKAAILGDLPDHEVKALMNEYGHLVTKIASNKYLRLVSGIDYYSQIDLLKDKHDYV